MTNHQFSTFNVQSEIMLKILDDLDSQKNKKYFIIIGEVGTGKTTMLNYINKRLFHNNQKYIFDDMNIQNINFDSAIITTSKKSAENLIEKFNKEDLYIVEMPNLSERRQDIMNFSQFFIEVLSLMNNKKTGKLTDKAIEKLLQYGWPGNFHELEAVLERAFERGLSGLITENSKKRTTFLIEPEHIDLNFQTEELEFTIGQRLEQIERKYILQTLYFVQQNRTKAAEILGISIRTLRNKINQYREEGFL